MIRQGLPIKAWQGTTAGSQSQISLGKEQGAEAELVKCCCTMLEVLDLQHPQVSATVITSMR